ncbi:trypsin 3A1-like [Belonocnema kinseyi]|uniref:trypsin 3A1-like n=1 Tax=Belonocnema kinseyi TaxID=2817044 RepID=UPI00143D8E9E|nr:trypsin 3A1-like [Belonocnema kinseyi]
MVKLYLKLLIVGAIVAQEIWTLPDDYTKLHIRKKRLVNRIPGGNQPTRIEQAPHLVSVHLNNNHTCSGTILYSNVILVMADCVHLNEPHTYKVISGTNRRDAGTTHNVLKIAYHPEYYPSEGDMGNMALLEINPPIDLVHSPNRKIALYYGNLSPNTVVQTSGWGDNRLDRRPHPILLRTITVPTISTELCKSLNNNDPLITEAVICTHDTTLQQHACDGDESNPLNDLENRYLYGIMLWTRGRGFPDVYLNLSYPDYKAWIVPEIVRIASKRPLLRAP